VPNAPPSARPVASVSLDLDNLWSYLRIHGDPAWAQRPSYLRTFVPHALGLLERLGLKITVFIVGADAAGQDRGVLREITSAGHEVGNHSFEHESWLDRYGHAQLVEEIARAEDAVAEATGQRPVGFRGPGFSWSADLLEILAERGYLFDASTLPTFIGPLARAYYFRSARLTPEQRVERAGLFGHASDGLRSNRPYRWRLASGRALLEIPVTTMPIVRLPFHLSYLLYLSRVSERLMHTYLRTALIACRVAGVGPSFLLHPLDLIGGDQVHGLAFFPGMDVPSDRKADLFTGVLSVLREYWDVVPMGRHAEQLLADSRLAERAPGRA
jgi:peptidoglycan/xylan/chitin deacetylase (PgdA/CDA1 family)